MSMSASTEILNHAPWLAGVDHSCDPLHPAGSYGAALLQSLGAASAPHELEHAQRTSDRWRESGLADITGYAHAPLEHCPVPIADYADGTLAAIKAVARLDLPTAYRGADLTTIRAKQMSLTRNGDVSAGGSCRFLPCQDGVIAVSLARESDWELLDAWLLADVSADWTNVAKHVARHTKAHLLLQGRLLGLAVADAAPKPPSQTDWFEIDHRGRPRPSARPRPRVIDLSSLWAGPLCGQILRWSGGDVTKIESTARPDGGRFGSAAVFDLLNAGKAQMQLDFGNAKDIDRLKDMIRSADIVIEGSRPRALRQLDIRAEELMDQTPGLTWVSITGYGRQEPEANWIAYGDDAGVAGGLSAEIYRATGTWMFCGDAIADPMTGLHAALAALASQKAGGGHLISVPMVKVIRHCVLHAKRSGHG